MLFYLSILLTATCVCLVAIRPKEGILFTLIAKPVIDTTWGNPFFGIKLAYIVGALFPTIVTFYFVFVYDKKSEIPLIPIWLAYTIINLLSSFIILYFNPKAGLETFFKVFNGLGGYLMLQMFFVDKEDFKKLLIFLMIAGIFPMGQGLFQWVTGHAWKTWEAAAGYRNIGLYHDHATLKYYFFQTVTAIMLYSSYFAEGSKKGRLMLTTYFWACVPVLYKLYVKSGYVAFGWWMFIWSLFRKKIVVFTIVLLSILVLNMALGNRIFKGVTDTLEAEISALEGEVSYDKTLAGRWKLWGAWYKEWQKLSLLQKFFGSGEKGYGLHNDYLFAVQRSGLLGLSVYMILLLCIGLKITRHLLLRITPMTIMAFMLFSLWIEETIGLVPSGFPSFQWFCWGFIGLSFRIFEQWDYRAGKASLQGRTF